MTSEIRRPVLLDADVLAASMTRTLIMSASAQAGARFLPLWSRAIEVEADRHARAGQVKLAEVRERWWGTDVLIADPLPGDINQWQETSIKDRHVLAAAVNAGIGIVVSRNVGDFGLEDLVRGDVVVAHPDQFLAAMITPEDYRHVLSDLSARRTRSPNQPAELHAALGREHPRLFAGMSTIFPAITAESSSSEPPALVFRGRRCLVCQRVLRDPFSLIDGIGPECRSAA